ncbi:MAG: alpha/beta fold hydrolase [Clostridia bacterium]|nr:alpha/beta fold hydrolase [Clostridia bacterium]
MDTGILIIVIFFSVIGAWICLVFGLALISDKIAFGKRYDKNPLLKYFTAEDFGLTAEEVSVNRGKFTLNGYIYRNERVPAKNKTVVFVHGMGAGHLAYTTEIAYFANLGYPVLALDSKGCNLSGGKNIKGMYEGVNSAVAAIDCAKEKLPQNGIYLVGHSWGGYSALCASEQREVEKVVAISAPNSPMKTMQHAVSPILSPFLAAYMTIWWVTFNMVKFGSYGNSHASNCVAKSKVPILLVHGDKDNIVKKENAAYYCINGENVEKLLCEGKAHNPYNTVRAEQKLAELSSALKNVKKTKPAEAYSYFDKFDFKAATEEDEEVMQKIAEFLN